MPKLWGSAFSQDGVTETTFTLPPETTKKERKEGKEGRREENDFFQEYFCISGNEELWFMRDKKQNPMIASSYCLKRDYSMQHRKEVRESSADSLNWGDVAESQE